MRILLTYGLDPITGSVENKPCLNKRVKESVRRLLNEMVEFSFKELDSDQPKVTPSKRRSSPPEHFTWQEKGQISVPMKQGDWVCPKCNFLNFARNVKCLRCDGLFQERLRKPWEDRDHHLPMKKGDWLCDKCNFLNFAKNTRCLQCKEKPPKRQLNPGEWECDSCNYINFKKNMVCLKCDWKRPKASNYPNTSAQLQHEERGFHQPHRMKFVRDEDETNGDPSGRQERQSRNESVDICMEDDGSKDDGGLSPWNKCSEFEDFPIVGGKSALSQNPRNLEIWRREMSKRRRSVSKDRESDDELSYANFQRRLEFLESTDDEEIDGWFGYDTKIEKEKPKTVPCTIRE
ncbi:hypothetical protein HHK36_029940 [Tetracentron sinense]|uniref:RanBP2-type domain-containing protein n=1 Tax=Tetracentron sinense TaxID=13715 RepID=A0A835CZT4_TETSI|nr:hypothetical protein HHK36_029940 [Tetracentron sinense]